MKSNRLMAALAIMLLAIFISASYLPVGDAEPAVYRDLNKNGKLDPYENPMLSSEKRVEDLISQMTVAEKAGQLFINGAEVWSGGVLDDRPNAGIFQSIPAVPELIQQKHMTHLNVWTIPSAGDLATWVNEVQQMAEETRLGIPVTIASDPVNAYSALSFNLYENEFSQWPEQLGMGALQDEELVKAFAEVARKEYRAVGLSLALHPVADLATEPRWPRNSSTFGEDAKIAANLIEAYVAGFQGEEITESSVACMTKHFPGGGPQHKGLDPHFPFHEGQRYPGENFDYHLHPFKAAFASKTAAVMPYYGVPKGYKFDEVGFAYNKEVITTLLQNQLGFTGIICSDWGLVNDMPMIKNIVWPARAWGFEQATPTERVLQLFQAGIDLLGGEHCPELLVDLVEQGQLAEERLDVSLRKVLKLKFDLGLFDNPYVEVDKVYEVIGRKASLEAGQNAQSRSMTLLKNTNALLPLQASSKVYVRNMDPSLVAQYAQVVFRPEDADVAIIRLRTPFESIETDNLFAKLFHHGDISFKDEAQQAILDLTDKVPTVIDIYLDRPVVFPVINNHAEAVIANYGADDRALLETLFGKVAPEGRLPFELPSSMSAVRAQKEDVPYDSEKPLYPFGFGLNYENTKNN